jgi:hypothetical protein
LIEAHLAAHLNRIRFYALKMGVRRLILGFYREGESLDGAAVQLSDLFRVSALLVGQILFVFDTGELQKTFIGMPQFGGTLFHQANERVFPAAHGGAAQSGYEDHDCHGQTKKHR